MLRVHMVSDIDVIVKYKYRGPCKNVIFYASGMSLDRKSKRKDENDAEFLHMKVPEFTDEAQLMPQVRRFIFSNKSDLLLGCNRLDEYVLKRRR